MEPKNRKNSLLNACQAVLALFVILFMVPDLFAGPKVANQQPGPEKASKVEKQTAPAKEEEKSEEKEKPYEYNPAGKTDPFVSFLSKPGRGKGAKSLSAKDLELEGADEFIPKGEPETELEKIEISKLTLTAVIRGKIKVWAMVIDPKGKGYFLEKGTKIGKHSGVVDEIICEEKETDFGPEIVRKVIIKVPYRDRNRKIIYKTIEMEMPYTKL